MTHVLFALLRSEVCGDAVGLPSSLSPDEMAQLYRLAAAHDLAHIAGQALGKCGCLGDDEASKQFKTAAMTAVMRYVQLQHRYEQLCAVLGTVSRTVDANELRCGYSGETRGFGTRGGGVV